MIMNHDTFVYESPWHWATHKNIEIFVLFDWFWALIRQYAVLYLNMLYMMIPAALLIWDGQGSKFR